MSSLTGRTHFHIRNYIRRLQEFADRVWYPPFIGLLAALDNFILVIPNDGILISSSMLTPRRWFFLALNVSVGSTVGALALAAIVEHQGLPWLLQIYPDLEQGSSWLWAVEFFDKYGMAFVFLVAVSPLIQQPAIILASLASTPLVDLAAVIFLGRAIKFLLMAYLGSHAPRVLSRLWGLKGELEDVGIKIK